MRSAFKRGVELLSESESDTVQSQGKTVEVPGKSAAEHTEGIGRAPKNLTQLKPVINELMRKVNMIAI